MASTQDGPDSPLHPHPGSTSALLDLSGLDLPTAGATYPVVPTRPAEPASPEQPSTSVSLLDDELMSLGEEGLGPEEGGRAGCGWGWCLQCVTQPSSCGGWYER